MPANLAIYFFFCVKYSKTVADEYLSRGIIDESTDRIDFMLPHKTYSFSKIRPEVKVFIDGLGYTIIGEE